MQLVKRYKLAHGILWQSWIPSNGRLNNDCYWWDYCPSSLSGEALSGFFFSIPFVILGVDSRDCGGSVSSLKKVVNFLSVRCNLNENCVGQAHFGGEGKLLWGEENPGILHQLSIMVKIRVCYTSLIESLVWGRFSSKLKVPVPWENSGENSCLHWKLYWVFLSSWLVF